MDSELTSDYASLIGGSVPGLPGEDYPVLAAPPDTSFTCLDRSRVNGGYYADSEARCQGANIILISTHVVFYFNCSISHLCGRGGIGEIQLLMSQRNVVQPAVLRVRLVVQRGLRQHRAVLQPKRRAGHRQADLLTYLITNWI